MDSVGGGPTVADASRAVFLSYASQDAEAALKICEALRAAGIEVWLDQSELRGGDAWDHKIRQQIRDCRLFVPVISAHTERRVEGYFRREWSLAVDRALEIAEGHTFLLPVVIDGTAQESAKVPARFRTIQWTPLVRGEVSADFVGHVRQLLEGRTVPPMLATAERRQLTVLYSDLVGPTTFAARMDPEDLREVIAAYHRCVAERVRRVDGFVAQFFGEGVVVYFGYPQAHEDDAERAVRAALELIMAVSDLDVGVKLQTRVGIATGLVVVDDLEDSGSARKRGIIGETLNLAVGLQEIAEPNTVVIAESTRRLLGGLFELTDLGAIELKGIHAPLRAWRALRAGSAEGRFEALHATELTALVGREEECDLLLRRWSKACSGDGQVVLLSGEAGIGKSRITVALLERLEREPLTRLRYFCSPQYTASALHPIISQMEHAADMAHNDSPQARLDKLAALLARSLTSREDKILFAEMLALPADGRDSMLQMTSEQHRQKTLEAIITRTETLAGQNPVLIVFEDAHWSDPTSLEVLNLIVERIQKLHALLIVTFRPEFEAPWIGEPHVTSLSLHRLTELEIGALIDRIADRKSLPDKVRRKIIERTDGIPLFVEEMTKAVLEAEDEEQAQRIAAAAPSAVPVVPATLHASLLARLDRLGSAKEVAQIGATIGREFSHSLISAVAGTPEASLNSALDRLVRSGLLFKRGVPPYVSYLFKHALVQDTAYSTLLREVRRALHARIASVLETRFTDVAERQPELLARHYTEAGLIEKAADFWGKAGQQSLVRSALVEAVEQLSRAVDQISRLPGTAALRREGIKLQVALFNTLFHVKGWVAPETMAALQQAQALIEEAKTYGESPEDPLLYLSVLYGFWVANFVAYHGDLCLRLATEFLSLANAQKATGPRVVGHQILGMSVMHAGNFLEARAHYDLALTMYDPAEHRQLAMQFGADRRVVPLARRSALLWILGYPDAARSDVDQALSEARQIGQAATLMYALNHVAFALFQCGDYQRASTLADECTTLAEEKGAIFSKAFGMLNQGCVHALSDNHSEAIQLITSGLVARQATGATVWNSISFSYLARAYAHVGRLDDARVSIERAMTNIAETNERWGEAEIHRIAGEIALLLPKPDLERAESHFIHALEVARAQSARSWELRAAMSMARMNRDQGNRVGARELLAPVCGWFTEGRETADLQHAKALLDSLSSPAPEG